MIIFFVLNAFANDFTVEYSKGISIKRAYREGYYAVDIPIQFPPLRDLYTVSAFVTHNWKDKPLERDKSQFQANVEEQLNVIINSANGQLFNGDTLERAAQLCSLFHIGPNESNQYISRYEKLMEPWELLLFTTKEENKDKIPTKDSFSAAVSVVIALKKGKIIRYKSQRSHTGSIYGVFIPQERRSGLGISTQTGTIFPMSIDLTPSVSKSVEYFTLDQALDLAYGNDVTPENSPITLDEQSENIDSIPDLPPETVPQKRPERSLVQLRTVQEGFAWTWIILITSFVLYMFVLAKKHKDRVIQKAIEERKAKEKQQTF